MNAWEEDSRPVVWLVNHYGGPPGQVRSERSWRIVRGLAEEGFTVCSVFASHHHIQVATEGKERDEESHEEHLFYIPVETRPYEGNGLGRVLNMIDFYRGLKRLLAEEIAPIPNLVIASSPHPLTFLFALHARSRRGCRVVLEERDLWPMSLVELVGTPRWHPVVWIFHWITGRGFRNCDALVSLLPDSENYFLSRGLGPGRFRYIPNGVGEQPEPGSLDPLPESITAWLREVRDGGQLAVVYTGAMGPPNGLDQLLNLRPEGGEDKRYAILCVGEGVERERLTREVEEEGWSHVRFHPPISRSASLRLIREADVCLISLKPSSIFKYGVSPNKLFEYMAAGKPVIFSVNSSNNPVEDAGAGFTVEPYDAGSLENALRQLAEMSPEERQTMGEKGRSYIAANHDWRKLGRDYARVCRETLEAADESPAAGPYPGKRCFDIAMALAGLILLSPLMLVIIGIIRLRLGSPVFFRQKRPGLRGELFELIKFRTMRDAVDEEGNPLPDEERLSAFGNWLRHSSLDEMPELWNVLRGDMSLVGPRPLLEEYLPLYNERQARRHEVRPGVTGWAQVNGRNAVSWRERFEMDVWYVDNRSFLLDLRILCLTVVAVFGRKGVTAEGHATMPKFDGSEETE